METEEYNLSFELSLYGALIIYNSYIYKNTLEKHMISGTQVCSNISKVDVICSKAWLKYLYGVMRFMHE